MSFLIQQEGENDPRNKVKLGSELVIFSQASYQLPYEVWLSKYNILLISVEKQVLERVQYLSRNTHSGGLSSFTSGLKQTRNSFEKENLCRVNGRVFWNMWHRSVC